MCFHSSQCRHPCQPHISYNSNDISYRSELKFLGTNITDNLIWNIHVCSVCASLSKVHQSIKSLKDVTSFHMIQTIYYAYFQSRMKYGIIFWGRNKESVKAFGIQKKAILLISGVKPHDSCKHIFMEYGISTVASLYILQALCSIKKFKGNLKHDFHFHGYNTRGKTNLHKQSCTTALF